jgi:hypothetical protein
MLCLTLGCQRKPKPRVEPVPSIETAMTAVGAPPIIPLEPLVERSSGSLTKRRR